MKDPQNTAETVECLREVQVRVSDVLRDASAEQFYRGDPTAWSAADYLKHLMIAIKPLARAMSLPVQAVAQRFGVADHPSRTYTEINSAYTARLAQGVRAEDYQTIMPDSYRFPEGVLDQHAHLLEAWTDANQRLIDALEQWSEDDLDRCQFPHAALGTLTVREMVYFTLIHNRLHAEDIEQALRQP